MSRSTFRLKEGNSNQNSPQTPQIPSEYFRSSQTFLSSFTRRELLPSLLVRSSSIAPTDIPRSGVERYDSRSQPGDHNTDAMSTICVAGSEVYAAPISTASKKICLQLVGPCASLRPIWVRENVTVAEFRQRVKSLTRILPR